jgi:hypothetical protein
MYIVRSSARLNAPLVSDARPSRYTRSPCTSNCLAHAIFVGPQLVRWLCSRFVSFVDLCLVTVFGALIFDFSFHNHRCGCVRQTLVCFCVIGRILKTFWVQSARDQNLASHIQTSVRGYRFERSRILTLRRTEALVGGHAVALVAEAATTLDPLCSKSSKCVHAGGPKIRRHRVSSRDDQQVCGPAPLREVS